MDFTFTEEQQKLREEIRDFCQKEPLGETDDIGGTHPGFSPSYLRRAAAKGLIGLAIPKEYGGRGLGFIEEMIFDEETGAHAPPGALGGPLIGTTIGVAEGVFLKIASEEQKRYFLPKITKGDLIIGQGITEGVGGSDVLSFTTRAVRQGDHYIINGEKIFNTWGHQGAYLRKYGISLYPFFLAKTDPNAPPEKSFSLFLFDGNVPPPGTDLLPGMSLNAIFTTGMRSNEIFFDDVRIPAESLLGEENHGWEYLLKYADFYWNRYIGGTMPRMEMFLQGLVQYAKTTKFNGQPLSENALIRHRLAESAILIEEHRLLTYRYTSEMDKGLNYIKSGSLVKFHSSKIMDYMNETAIHMLGPYGQLKGGEYAPMRGAIANGYMRSGGMSFVNTGPNAMRNNIADHWLGLPIEFGTIL